MQKRTGAVVLLLATLVVAAAHGQEPKKTAPTAAPRAEGFMFPMVLGGGVEHIMRLRDELKLTDDQLRQLEEIRKQQVQRAQEMIELRSRAAAGQIDREAMRAQMEERRDQMRKEVDAMRDQVDKIITQEQRDRLGERTREMRGAIAPRMGRGLRLREEPRMAPRMTPRIRGEPLPRAGRLAPRLRNLNELDVVPRYYWFGAGPVLAPGRLRRRGIL